MNARRRLRKLADKAKLTAVSLNAKPHGCEVCRADDFRTSFAKAAIQAAELGTYVIVCKACGEHWEVTLFCGVNGQLHIGFNPAEKPPSN